MQLLLEYSYLDMFLTKGIPNVSEGLCHLPHPEGHGALAEQKSSPFPANH